MFCECLPAMGVTYFKRFRMEVDLSRGNLREPPLPRGYHLLPWSETLLPAHAETKFKSFRTEIDANIFPCLGDPHGCRRLMDEISQKEGFLPDATWLAVYANGQGESEACGTIQGIRDRAGHGAIQNVGITPIHRGQSLGTCLVVRSLNGFRRAGLNRVSLEVTAQNDGAVRLYRRLGFAKVRTVYKAVEVAYT